MTTKFKPGDRVRALRYFEAKPDWHAGLVKGKQYTVFELDTVGWPIFTNKQKYEVKGWDPEWFELVTDEPTSKAAPHDYKPYDRIRIHAELTISYVDANTVRVMHPEWQEGVNLRHSDLAALKPERLPPALTVGDRVRTLGGVHGVIKALHNDSAWIYHPQLDEYRTFEVKSLERVEG